MEVNKLTAWERAKSHTSLLCLLQGLQGKVTTVELRNECSVTGRIEYVNGFMDTHMSDVLFKDMFDVETKMEKFFVRGAHIRCVIIPDEVNIIETMERRLKMLRYESGMGSTASTIKAMKEARGRGRGRGNKRDKAQMHRDDAAGKTGGNAPNLMAKDKLKGKERFEEYMQKFKQEKDVPEADTASKGVA